MRNVSPVMQRELGAFFYSPIAYAVLTIFLILLGIFFTATTFQPGGQASLERLAELMPIVFVVFLPVLTMRLLSDEYRTGTIETLMTAPIGETDVVIGKFFGALVFLVVMLSTTLLYAFVVNVYGRLDWGMLASTYLGMLLLGALYLSVGLFFSACTGNQIIAAVSSMVLLLVFTFLAEYLANEASGALKLVLRHLSIREHFRGFTRGILDGNDIVFFVTSTGLFLFLTVKVLESRRWR